jgi:subtilase family serine protease
MPLPGRRPQGVTSTVTLTVVLSILATTVLAVLPAASARAGITRPHVKLAPAHAKARATAARLCNVASTPGHYSCFALRRTDVPAVRTSAGPSASFAAQVGPPGLHPADLRAAYGLPSTTGGEGQTVYIIDAYNHPNAEADLAVYRSQFGLTACTTANGCFRKLNQDGATSPLPANNAGWAGEIALDLDMVSAICPKCHITLIEAKDPSINMLLAVGRATSMGAKFVSMSWGGTETLSAPNFDNAYFAPTGVVYAASSGDSGYAGGTIYPASSNRVIAVGGTRLSPAANTRGWTESAWAGAGSSCSAYEAKPTWQGGVPACTKRAGTDISAVADPSTGVSVYLTYGGSGWSVFGGTSAAAPIVAAAYALAGQQPGGASPAKSLYSQPSKLYDVTSGSTGSCNPIVLCTAGQGWDGPTGLGTPHGIGAFTASRATNPTRVNSPYWKSRPVPIVVTAVVPADHVP